MSKRITAGVTAILTAGALAVPATGLAASHSHHSHRHKVVVACPTHKKSGKHKGALKGKKKGALKGKKCYAYVG